MNKISDFKNRLSITDFFFLFFFLKRNGAPVWHSKGCFGLEVGTSLTLP